MQLTTSKRISLKFTLYTICIVFFFGILVNIIFFQQRYRSENARLWDKGPMAMNMIEKMEHRLGVAPHMKLPGIEELPDTTGVLTVLQQNTLFSNIAVVEDQYLLYRQSDSTIKISNISRLVDAQQRMISIFLLLLIIFSLGTYFVSLLFVRSSLKNIHELVAYVQKLNIHTLHEPVPLSGPDDDEIRIIGQTLQQTLTTIKEQTDSLKDFVSHASHELKTPLMSLSAVLDAGQKTGNYEKTFVSAKSALQTINTLFETLLSLTKWEYHNIETTNLDIVPLIQEIGHEIAKAYKKKQITYTVSLPKTYMVRSNQDIFHIIVFNLLQNAYKYTPDHGTIHLQLNKDTFEITNSGQGISPAQQKHIRQKFRKDHSQGGSKEGFGLGLYLVKLLVTKHHWNIDVQSIPDQTTTFSIHLKH